jgi:NADPH:quinone reductase-like Zn-dependent oxidoreductase
MRAALYHERGPAAQVLSVGEVAVPEPGPGEVLVRVRVSGVNPTDWKARAAGGPLPWPYQVPGQDGAGDVEAVGADVDPSRVGERVWVYHAADLRPHGTAAQYTVVPAEQAVRLPDTITYEQGAGLGIPYITAHHCVFGDGPVDARTLLVTGGAGAVGSAAIQLASWGGARVLATVSSPAKGVIATASGADAVLGYRDEGFLAALATAAPDGVHRVVDVALGANLAADLSVLRRGGTIVTYASESADPVVPTRQLMTENVTLRFVLVYTLAPSQLAHAVADITAALDDGALHELPRHVFGLDETAAAHEAVEAGAVGKVLVEIG